MLAKQSFNLAFKKKHCLQHKSQIFFEDWHRMWRGRGKQNSCWANL